MKHSMADAGNLGVYKLENKTLVLADASPFALGAVLMQTNSQELSKVVNFSSKSFRILKEDTAKRRIGHWL